MMGRQHDALDFFHIHTFSVLVTCGGAELETCFVVALRNARWVCRVRNSNIIVTVLFVLSHLAMHSTCGKPLCCR